MYHSSHNECLKRCRFMTEKRHGYLTQSLTPPSCLTNLKARAQNSSSFAHSACSKLCGKQQRHASSATCSGTFVCHGRLSTIVFDRCCFLLYLITLQNGVWKASIAMQSLVAAAPYFRSHRPRLLFGSRPFSVHGVSLAPTSFDDQFCAAVRLRNTRKIADLIVEARKEPKTLSTESMDALKEFTLATKDFIPANLYLEHVASAKLDKTAAKELSDLMFTDVFVTAVNDAMSLRSLCACLAPATLGVAGPDGAGVLDRCTWWSRHVYFNDCSFRFEHRSILISDMSLL